MLCDYGCGKVAIKLFKNGKNCCASSVVSCPSIGKRITAGNKKFITNFNKEDVDAWKQKCKKHYVDKVSPRKGKTFQEIYGERATTILENHKLCHIGKNLGKKHSAETKLKRSLYAKLVGFGGYREGSGRGKKGRYKGYWCDSSWELAWIIYNLDHNIKFERNKQKFEYQYNGQTKNWIPDFILSDKSYVEIKGYMSEQVQAKLQSFVSPIKVIDKVDIEPIISYVELQYGKDYIKLYDK